MCGVAGYFSLGRPIEPDRLARAIEALRHRGPDDRGSWISENGRVALGQSRLAINDLLTGRQPIENEDGTIRAVVNGEF
jgi:asparagine synthase (glutamine-hydrolysing)